MIVAVHSFLINHCSENVWKNIMKHICIELQLLSYKFCKTKDWLNPYNDYNKVPQNLENKLKGLHFST